MFSGLKRTCQARLEQHNESRRVPALAAAAAPAVAAPAKRRRVAPGATSAPASAATASRHGESADPLSIFDASAFGSDVLDLDALLALEPAGAAGREPAAAVAAAMAPPPVVSALAAEVAASLGAHCAHIKLPRSAGLDAGQPLSSELTSSITRLLAALGVPPAALAACVRPGCVLLTLDVLTPARGAGGSGDALAPARLLAALAADEGALGALLRAQPHATVRIGDAEATATPPGAAAVVERVAAAPRPPPIAPLVALSTDAVALAPLAPLDGTLVARLGAAVLPIAPLPGGGLALPACGLEGALLLELLQEDAPLHRAGAPRPVLLTTDARAAAELATALDALACHSRSAAERAVLLLGAAMAPQAAAAVLAPASALAACLRLPATLTRLSLALRQRCAAEAVPFEPLFLRLLRAAGAGAARAALYEAHPDIAAGVAAAAGALRAAAAEGHALPPCVLAAAADALARAQQPQPHAAAVLAALAASCVAPPDEADADDEAEGAAADAALAALLAARTAARFAETETGYVEWLCDINLGLWRSTGILALFVHTVHTCLYFAYIRNQPSAAALLARGAVLRKQVNDVRFYDPADLSAPPLTMLDYPWHEVLAAAPIYVAWTTLVHIPTHICILACANSARLRPFVRRNYEAVYGTLCALELSSYIFMDSYIYYVTGRVPRYATADCTMHALGVLLFHRTGMFRLPLSLFIVALRSFVTLGTCIRTGAWQGLLWRENAVQAAALALMGVLAPLTDRRLRARYAAHAAAKLAVKEKVA